MNASLADETVVRWDVAGPETGLPILLLCGITVPLETFDRNVQALASSGLRVYRMDYPGRGGSDAPEGAAYDLEFFVASVLDFLRTVGVNRPLGLVGLSMGGAVAATLASRHPEQFTRVAFLDPLFFSPRPQGIRRWLIPPRLGDWVFTRWGKTILEEGQRTDFFDPGEAEAFLPLYRPFLDRPGILGAVLKTFRSLGSWSVTPAFGQLGILQTPVLLVWGRFDKTIPFARNPEVRALVPQARFVSVDGAGHVPHWERPDEVNQALVNFFLT
jgi:pimeloyl-ACP methyl ester carboxylesterase